MSLRPPHQGCTCACHHTPGMLHMMPCCYPEPEHDIHTEQTALDSWVAWTPAPSGLRNIYGHGASEVDAIRDLAEHVQRWRRFSQPDDQL